MKTSLGLVLGLCLTGLQFVAIVAIVFSSYLTSERVLLDHARGLLGDVGLNTIAHSQGFLDPAQGAAELAARLAENRIVAIENKHLLEKLLFQQLQATSQFAGVFYGDEEGNFVYVMRSDGPGPFRSKIITRSGDARETDLIWRDRDFTQVASRPDPEDTYDPRTRPWYQLAQSKGETVWTDPYIFFSSQTPGITIAAPVLDDDSRVRGVIGVDIEISAISDFLSKLRVGESGTALIVNRNGDVIAHPKPELLKTQNTDGTFRFSGIDEIDDPIAREAFGDLSQMETVRFETERYAAFSYGGEDYVSTIMPTMSDMLPWTIAVYAPEKDFIGAIIANRTRDIWIAAAVALLTGMVGLLLANYINRPVRAFAVRAALVSQGEVDPSAPMPRTYKELERANDTLTSEILQRKKTEREYGQTFELSSRGMVQINPVTGNFIKANKRFADLLGYDSAEILHVNANDLSAPEDETPFSQFLQDALNSGASTIETCCLKKDGGTIWVRVNAILIRDNDGQPLHVVATIDDITRSRNSAAQIEKLNRDIAHLARGELLSQMAAGLAHELNQPLTAITQNADTALLTAREETVQNDELIQILNDLDQQAHRAADIIKALRNFARKGEEWKAPFDLCELIDQTMRLVNPEVTEHAIKVTVDCAALPLALGIRVQIAQVLVNLLRNAIEATVSGGGKDRKIWLDAQVKDDFIVVSVEDNGPGIDPDLALFVQFETTKENGMGLGLTICRSIVESGGGQMWLEPNNERGACFRFTIPTAT